METVRILLCCGAGMSSGFLASNTRKVAKKKKLNVTVEARSISEVGEYLDKVDVLLLGPHYSSELDQYKTVTANYDVKVAAIPQEIYATLDGARLLDLAFSLLK
ncbi:PTS sugar transporter subunit IIB [Faecalicoccus pleomorphus]|uniref:PTS sugar transporter subunit IIB n=1 Tax=Faecalicoccus pleomorphus TaxID=1323 RepID=UPI0022E3FCF5|nr:PTS sugar transporter subunit IIB [Faecalicoccus pleomorphus]